MENKIKELIKIVKLLEKLVIQLISLFGWIAILVFTIKGIFVGYIYEDDYNKEFVKILTKERGVKLAP